MIGAARKLLGPRTAVVLIVAAGVLALAFKLFEPGIVWFWGWKPLPAGSYRVTSIASEEWSDVGERARAWLVEARSAMDAPALSAAVSVDGAIVWVGVTGYADIEDGRAATPETAFRIGSSSKAVTSVAMGTLIARGAVDLDAPVSSYMPDLREPLARVTTRQAMGHLAGVRDYGLCLCFPIWEYYNRKHYETQRDSLRPFERSALLFPPGEGFSYSSYGYNVAGGVIESVAGAPFPDFLEEALFGPLGMSASHADAGRPNEGDATFYDVQDGRFKEAFRVDNTNKLPSGGILSTPSDMVRLGRQMIAPTLFDAATRDLLMRPQQLADGAVSPQLYGLGWRYQGETPILEGAATTPRLHHHGTALGSTSHFTVYPEYGMVVSVMMNVTQGERSLGEHANVLADIFAAELEAQAR